MNKSNMWRCFRLNMLKKIRVAVIGFGNVGKGALEAIETAADMEIAGVVVRAHALEVTKSTLPHSLAVVTEIDDLQAVDVAVLAVPSRSVAAVAQPLLVQGISTVDSFDIHGTELWQLRQKLAVPAVNGGATAISAAGWDPGTDSMIRAIFALQAPRGTSYTNFGPGMSMGHTVAAKQIPGVKNAVAFTLPLGYGQHQRQVYVELKPGYELSDVALAIQADAYFSHDKTRVEEVNSVDAMHDTSHGVLLERHGTAGNTANQTFSYSTRVTNPALTGQILVSTARAAIRMPAGAYTMLEVPLAHFLPGDLQAIIEQFV